MLEMQLTPSQEFRQATVFGCVTFIRNPEGQILTFKELEDKPRTGKRIGDFSVLCETREEGESALTNMARGLHEELGIGYDQIESVLDVKNIQTWETGFMPGVWGDVFLVDCINQPLLDSIIGSARKPDGVEIVGWKTPEEFINSPVRVGVRNIIDKFSDEIFRK